MIASYSPAKSQISPVDASPLTKRVTVVTGWECPEHDPPCIVHISNDFLLPEIFSNPPSVALSVDKSRVCVRPILAALERASSRDFGHNQTLLGRNEACAGRDTSEWRNNGRQLRILLNGALNVLLMSVRGQWLFDWLCGPYRHVLSLSAVLFTSLLSLYIKMYFDIWL